MTPQELERAKDRLVEDLRAERDRIIATRKLEDIEEKRRRIETWPQYFERTNGGTDDNIPRKSKVV